MSSQPGTALGLLSQAFVDDNALDQPWYQPNASLQERKGFLDGKPTGNFVINDSVSQPGNFQLTYV
jgi:hypothetical protein